MPVDGTSYQSTADVLAEYFFERLSLSVEWSDTDDRLTLINSDVGLVTRLPVLAQNLQEDHSLRYLLPRLVPALGLMLVHLGFQRNIDLQFHGGVYHGSLHGLIGWLRSWLGTISVKLACWACLLKRSWFSRLRGGRK